MTQPKLFEASQRRSKNGKETNTSTKTGRGRARQADSKKRASFVDRIPTGLKVIPRRTESPLIPAHIRTHGVELSQDERVYIRRKLGMKLGKFASSIERVTVRVEDLNGPRGGVDQVCRIKVVLIGLPSVVYEEKDTSLDVAIDDALSGVERSVRKDLKRRRTNIRRRSKNQTSDQAVTVHRVRRSRALLKTAA